MVRPNELNFKKVIILCSIGGTTDILQKTGLVITDIILMDEIYYVF